MAADVVLLLLAGTVLGEVVDEIVGDTDNGVVVAAPVVVDALAVSGCVLHAGTSNELQRAESTTSFVQQTSLPSP